MLPTVYIETSIVSYASARLSASPQAMARQESARKWWAEKSSQFSLFASQLVLDEASRGDPFAAQVRLKLLENVPLIPITQEMSDLAAILLARSLMPPIAAADALHVAAAAVSGVDYLLTYNCRHIANAFRLPLIYALLDQLKIGHPLICTPDEFLGADDVG